MGTVTVACKIPNGLVLNANGQTVTIAGPIRAVPGTPAKPYPGGYELTPGVDADLWTAWSREHSDSDALKNGLIFAEPNVGTAAAKAKRLARTRSGFMPSASASTIGNFKQK
jgi:hypothetical protein